MAPVGQQHLKAEGGFLTSTWMLLFVSMLLLLAVGMARADTTPTLFKSFAGNVNFIGTEHTLRTAGNNTNPCSLVNNATTSAGSDPTSASVTIPNGATVEAAYLYWAASGSTPDYDVIFDGTAVSADTNRRYTATFGTAGFFSGVADVTAIVAAKGTGTHSFTFSGLTVDGSSTYCNNQTVLGGWSLLIIYSASSEDFRVLNLYEGFQQYQNSSITLSLSNFQIPSTFTSGRVAHITWEGDPTLSGGGENLVFNNGTTNYTLTDSINPPGNQFNSASNINGDTNSYGVDFDAYTLTAPDIFAGETSGSTIYSSGQDLVFLSAEILAVPNAPATDLSVSLTRNGNLTRGQNGSYSATVTNNGPLTEPGPITVTDTLPTGLTYVSGNGTNWSCSAAGQTITCTYTGTLSNGATTPALTLTVAVGASAPSSITNSVHATGTLFDNVPANNDASDTYIFESDLGIAMTNSGNFSVGQNSTFAITVNNNGPLDEPGPVTVVDSLPGGLSLISFSGTNWSCSGTTTLTCTYTGTIANGATAPALTLTVRPTSSGSFTNSATVTGTQDNNSTNNTATNTVGIQIGAYAYYAMEDGSWNGTGGEVKDGSGNGHNGTATGSAAITTQTGNDTGYICTGGNVPSDTTSAINTGINPNTIGNTGTIDFWYKSNTAWNSGGGQDYRVLLDASSSNYQFFLYLSNTGDLLFSVDTIDNRGRTNNNWLWSNSTYTDPANTWVHLAITWDIGSRNGSITIYRGVAGGTTSQIGSVGISRRDSAATYGTLYLGNANPSSYLANTYLVYSANGIIDEARLYNSVLTQSQIQADMDASHPCASSLAQFGINVGSSPASTCATHAVTVTAEDSSGTALAGYTGTVQISTSSGHGNWSLNSGSGTLTSGGADSGNASYTYSASDNGVATFSLSNTHADDLTVTVTDGSVTTTSSLLSFRDNVFVIAPTTCTGSSCPSTGSTEVVAGRPHGMKAELWTKDSVTGVCAIDTSYSASGIKGWYTPDTTYSTGAAPTIGGVTLPTSMPGSNNLTLNFINGTATFTLNTSDVGKYTLDLRDDSSRFAKDSSGNARPIIGSSNTLTVRPFAIDLRNVQLANGTANPGATAMGPGTGFTCAGCNFEGTATAVLWDSTDDSNNDGIPDSSSVDLSNNGIAPSYAWNTTVVAATPTTPSTLTGGHLGTLFAGTANPATLTASTFSGGNATATNLNYSEVGSVTLQPRAAANFRGTAGISIPSASVVVGRFYAARLSVSANTPVLNAADGTFTYLGQEFAFSINPVLTIIGLNATGGTTLNYDQSFWALNTGLTGRSYAKSASATTPASLALTTNGGNAVLTGTTTTDASGNPIYDGTGTLTISGDKLTYSKQPSPEAPFAAAVDLTVPATELTDSDGACYDPNTDSVCDKFVITGMTGTSGTNMRWGRVAMQNANGSELTDLQVPMVAQYYNGNGFVANTDDTSTTATISLTGGIAASTCVQDTGNPGLSGSGCSAAGPASEQFVSPPVSGTFTLWFRAPTGGVTGSIDATAIVPAWLKYPWDGSGTPGYPVSHVTFGTFQGNPRDIYRRELY